MGAGGGWESLKADPLYSKPRFIIPQKKKKKVRPLSAFVWSSPFFFSPIPVLCNHVFLLFQAWEARALTEEDRGPQQVEIFLPSFPFFRSARDISGGGGGGRRG